MALVPRNPPHALARPRASSIILPPASPAKRFRVGEPPVTPAAEPAGAAAVAAAAAVDIGAIGVAGPTGPPMPAVRRAESSEGDLSPASAVICPQRSELADGDALQLEPAAAAPASATTAVVSIAPRPPRTGRARGGRGAQRPLWELKETCGSTFRESQRKPKTHVYCSVCLHDVNRTHQKLADHLQCASHFKRQLEREDGQLQQQRLRDLIDRQRERAATAVRVDTNTEAYRLHVVRQWLSNGIPMEVFNDPEMRLLLEKDRATLTGPTHLGVLIPPILAAELEQVGHSRCARARRFHHAGRGPPHEISACAAWAAHRCWKKSAPAHLPSCLTAPTTRERLWRVSSCASCSCATTCGT